MISIESFLQESDLELHDRVMCRHRQDRLAQELYASTLGFFERSVTNHLSICGPYAAALG